MNIKNILNSYNLDKLSIWVLWWHSALDICSWIRNFWFKTICIAKKWRELTYSKYYKTRYLWNKKKSQSWKIWCIDECIILDEWWDLLKKEIQEKLRKNNTIFIHNRYFWTYFDFRKIEKNFKIPIYWSRELLKLEERDLPNNQYYLLKKAWIRIPKIYETPKLKIENWKLKFCNNQKKVWNLIITKVNNAIRKYERENFITSSWEEWLEIANEKINKWEITLNALQVSVIEEFILWAQINFNFFYSNLTWEIELMWTDIRRQTNLDGFLRLPAKEQLKIRSNYNPYHIETWHIAVTCKESLLEKAFIAWENFVKSCKENAQSLIWPFALQWAIETNWKKEEFVVFDVSFRIPWSPWISATPYSSYLYWKSISMWERIWMEIKRSINESKLWEILT